VPTAIVGIIGPTLETLIRSQEKLELASDDLIQAMNKFDRWEQSDVGEHIRLEKSNSAHMWGWNIGSSIGIATILSGALDKVGAGFVLFSVAASGVLVWYQIGKNKRCLLELTRKNRP